MAKDLEIERKFLVKELPRDWKRTVSSRVVQGYFPLAKKDLEIRLRRKGDRHCITIKAGHGRSRLEEEIEIPEAQFRALWPLTYGARICKERYQIPCAGHTIEMDVYQGPLRGLVTAEVEFSTRRQSDLFSPPPWFGREVTGRRQFTNAMLARHRGLPAGAKRVSS